MDFKTKAAATKFAAQAKKLFPPGWHCHINLADPRNPRAGWLVRFKRPHCHVWASHYWAKPRWHCLISPDPDSGSGHGEWTTTTAAKSPREAIRLELESVQRYMAKMTAAYQQILANAEPDSSDIRRNRQQDEPDLSTRLLADVIQASVDGNRMALWNALEGLLQATTLSKSKLPTVSVDAQCRLLAQPDKGLPARRQSKPGRKSSRK